jgi:hypothetical protein
MVFFRANSDEEWAFSHVTLTVDKNTPKDTVKPW